MEASDQPPNNTVFSEGWSGFTKDWFTPRIPAWKKHLVPVYKDKPCHWLEIGSYEGRSAIWALSNVLTHQHSSITCVDLWPKAEIEGHFDSNLKIAKASLGLERGKMAKIKGDSRFTLRTLPVGVYDVIYVDGDHQAKSAMSDGVLAWPLLKSGGFMIFDDYQWNFATVEDRKNKTPCCKAIDAFLNFWKDELKVVHHHYQVIVRKL